jgi:hypothetical protein
MGVSERIEVQSTMGRTYILPRTVDFDEILEFMSVRDALQSLKEQGYKIRITIEATAPCAISGASAEGETFEEAVSRLGVKIEDIARSKQDASPPLPSV